MSQLDRVVYIVEDDDFSRSLLQTLIQSAGIACKAFASATEFLGHFEAMQPGCLVLDVILPDMSGLELHHQLNQRGIIIPVILITAQGNVPSAVDAMRHGAFDYLQKPFSNEDLIDSVRRALHHDLNNRQAQSQLEAIRARVFSLTPREREVLDLIARGYTNKAMAGTMGVGERSVEMHRSHVMEKMGAGSVAQLVRMLIDMERRPGRGNGDPGTS